MTKAKETDLSINTDVNSEKKSIEKDKKPSSKKVNKETIDQSTIPWPEFIDSATDEKIKSRFSAELKKIITQNADVLNNYYFIALFDLESYISNFDLNRIFRALQKHNSNKEKDVLLILYSLGGNIEPAYQISKLCKSYSKNEFIVLIPRHAKSAATLLAIGADKIHMGPLGHLGPIDPQIDGLPALGVTQALESIASMTEKYPKSSEMFAKYLRMALTVEQIGYCQRIGESAEQYAERLLSTKPKLSKKNKQIAKELVHEYKDHGFVIDFDEARQHLGSDWIQTDTPELKVAEEIFNKFDFINLLLSVFKSQRLLIIGDILEDILIFNRRQS